jgi:hypothetical protein
VPSFFFFPLAISFGFTAGCAIGLDRLVRRPDRFRWPLRRKAWSFVGGVPSVRLLGRGIAGDRGVFLGFWRVAILARFGLRDDAPAGGQVGFDSPALGEILVSSRQQNCGLFWFFYPASVTISVSVWIAWNIFVGVIGDKIIPLFSCFYVARLPKFSLNTGILRSRNCLVAGI